MFPATNDNRTCVVAIQTTESKRKQGGRCGLQNDTKKDINALPDVVYKHVPIGKNDWSRMTAE